MSGSDGVRDHFDIRAAGVEDAEALHAMVTDLARETGLQSMVTSTADDLRRWCFGRNALVSALIAWGDDAPAGAAVYFMEFSTWRGRPGVYLQDLYVAPTARGSGVGKALVRTVLAAAQAKGAVYMRLAANADNERAARFYRAMGFDEHREDCLFVLEGDAFQQEAGG